VSAPPLVIATRNAGKLRELSAIFGAAGIAVIDLVGAGLAVEGAAEDGLEVHPSFAANAAAKARYFAELLGRPCVADDSGLQVRALGGAPGVRSRRWARDAGALGAGVSEDAANNALLVRALADVADRRARFVCAASYCGPPGEFVAEGIVEGEITVAPRGSGGFGYDPYFYVTTLGKTLAEASVAEKEAVGHRGAAFRALLRTIGSGIASAD